MTTSLRLLGCLVLVLSGCVTALGSHDESDGYDTYSLRGSDCYPSGNRYNCRPPDGDRGYAPRVYNPHTRSEYWPIAEGAHLRDGMGNVRGLVASDRVRVNLGMRKSIGGVTHVYAWTVELDSGIRASGWVREGALRDASTLRRRMETLRLPNPGEGEYETDWIITGGDNARFAPFKVTRDFTGGGREATDYLRRQGDVVNLIYNTPGRELGGYSVDTFPIGTHFHRARGVNQITVPLYRPGSTRVSAEMHFVYGFVWDGAERRYGWMAREALEAASGAPTPSPEPAPAPDPAPAGTSCATRCCDGTLAVDVAASSGGQCVSASSPVCEDHGYVLRARWGDDVVYERDSFCWALCRGRESYHRISGVTTGCTERATAFCAEGDRGGLQDALWSQCNPN